MYGIVRYGTVRYGTELSSTGFFTYFSIECLIIEELLSLSLSLSIWTGYQSTNLEAIPTQYRSQYRPSLLRKRERRHSYRLNVLWPGWHTIVSHYIAKPLASNQRLQLFTPYHPRSRQLGTVGDTGRYHISSPHSRNARGHGSVPLPRLSSDDNKLGRLERAVTGLNLFCLGDNSGRQRQDSFDSTAHLSLEQTGHFLTVILVANWWAEIRLNHSAEVAQVLLSLSLLIYSSETNLHALDENIHWNHRFLSHLFHQSLVNGLQTWVWLQNDTARLYSSRHLESSLLNHSRDNTYTLQYVFGKSVSDPQTHDSDTRGTVQTRSISRSFFFISGTVISPNNMELRRR